MKIFCVRHGETEWNRMGRFQGRTDIPLSDEGLRQAGYAAKALASVKLDSVWSSDLSRARETAEKIAMPHGLEVKEKPDITELSHGAWEGKRADEIEDLWPGMLDMWHKKPDSVTMPGGENLEMVRLRAVKGLSSIMDSKGENIVLVSHDALLKVLLCHILGCPLSCFWKFQLGNCSITVIERTSYGARIPLMGYMPSPGDPFARTEQKGL